MEEAVQSGVIPLNKFHGSKMGHRILSIISEDL